MSFLFVTGHLLCEYCGVFPLSFLKVVTAVPYTLLFIPLSLLSPNSLLDFLFLVVKLVIYMCVCTSMYTYTDTYLNTYTHTHIAHNLLYTINTTCIFEYYSQSCHFLLLNSISE